MIGAFRLDPFTSLLTYVRSDGSASFQMRKPMPPMDLFETRISRFDVVEHVTIRRYDFALEAGGHLVLEAENQHLLREALHRGKVDYKTGDVQVRIAIYASSQEAAEAVAHHAERAVYEAITYTTKKTLRRTKRERRRLARGARPRRMGCRRIPKTCDVTTPRIDLRTLLALHDRKFVEALRRGLPIRVETSGVPRCG